MAIKPKCYKCKKELNKPGAILLKFDKFSFIIISPPDENNIVEISSNGIDLKSYRAEKKHLCCKCYKMVTSAWNPL